MSELEQLKEIIAEDWRSLAWDGDKCDGFETVDMLEGDDRRWSRTNSAVVKAPSGQLFMFDWEHGLTESQDNECDWPEVRPVTAVTRMVEVTEYEVAA